MIKRPLILFSLVVIIIYTISALLTFTKIVDVDWKEEVASSYHPPSMEKVSLWLGTDLLGRSVLRKSLQGIEVAMTIGLVTSVVATVIGLFLGVMAGYFGGIIDEVVTWLHTVFSSIPGIMLLIAITFILGKGSLSLFLALGLTFWVSICRLSRGETIKHKNRDYVLAACAIGVNDFAIIFRHILPNILHVVIINFSLLFQSAIKSEVILSYIGLGVEGTSWGIMIDDAKQELVQGIWWQLLSAVLFMFFVVLALNILGDGLRDFFDPKLKGKR